MDEFPVIEGKRFWPFALCDLVDLFSYQINEYSLNLPNDPKAVADAVIRDIRYPFHLGQPDDSHLWNSFHGSYKFCKTVHLDFWQKASETAFIKVGDCEDSSILGTALSGKLVGAEEVYEVFGVVVDADTGAILGGHGWYICYWDGKWHLVESTLDTPPKDYPLITHFKEPYTLSTVIYYPMELWNWKHYEELSPIGEYLNLGFKSKERREKYEAIQKAWGIQTKPLKQARALSALRWRK
jgi:hypothetical protein